MKQGLCGARMGDQREALQRPRNDHPLSLFFHPRRRTQAKRLRQLRRDYQDDDADDDIDADETQEDSPLLGLGGGQQQPAAASADAAENTSARLSVIDEDDMTMESFWSKVYSFPVMTQFKADAAAESAEQLADKVLVDGGSSAYRLHNKRMRKQLQKKKVPKYKKGASTTVYLVLRFLSPVLVLIALFSTIYASYLSVIAKVQELTSISAAAGIRASCARQGLSELRKLEYLTTDPQYLATIYFQTMHKFDCVKHHVQLLSFGNKDPKIADKDYVLGVKGAPESGAVTALSTATSAAAYQAMFGDACGFLESSTYEAARAPGFSVTECRLFYGGLMNQGLAAALSTWWTMGYISADRQLKGLFLASNKSLLEGRGWSVPTEDFDYSLITCLPEKKCNPGVLMSPASAPLTPSYVSDSAYVGDIPMDQDYSYTQKPGYVRYWIANELNAFYNVFMIKADELYITPILIVLSQMYSKEALIASNSFINFLVILVPM